MLRSSRAHDASPARRLLIVRLGAVGDVVRTLPLAHALRAADPAAHLGWLVEEPAAPLLRAIPCIDEVHVLPRRLLARAALRPATWWPAARQSRELLTSLRRSRYEQVLDAHGTLKAALAARLAGAPVTGFAPGGSKEMAHLMHDVSLPFPAVPMSRVDRALFLGAAAGLLGDHPQASGETADFGLDFPAARARVAAALGSDARPLVVLFPFASASGQAKRWPLARHVELGRRLAERGARVLLAWGSPRESDEAARAVGRDPGVEPAPPTDLAELTELLRRARVLVTGDTGPMHLAAAVGTPVVALFGPSDPKVNRPWGPEGRHAVIVRHPLSDLSPDEVLPAVLERLR